MPDGIPHHRCPPAGAGVAATTGTDHLAATATVGCLNNGGTEHGPLGFNVPHLPRRLVPKSLPCAKVRSTIASQDFSTSRTSSGFFSIREVPIHFSAKVPAFGCHPKTIAPDRVLNSREGRPTSSLWAKPLPDAMGKSPTTRHLPFCSARRLGSRSGPGNLRPGQGRLGFIDVFHNKESFGLGFVLCLSQDLFAIGGPTWVIEPQVGHLSLLFMLVRQSLHLVSFQR